MAIMFSTKVTLITLLALYSNRSMEKCSFTRSLLVENNGLKTDKLTHLHFYFHETVSEANITSMTVSQASTTNLSEASFGLLNIADEPLAEGPGISSKLLGRAQGMFLSTSQKETALSMVFNYVFLKGKYNGSTLTVLGRNAVFNKVREMPVIGGTGVFRFTRGYARARTYSLNLTSGIAIVEYDVYLFHY